MKFIFFTILITLSNVGYSDDNSHNKMHEKNQEHKQHSSHDDDHKNHSMHKVHNELIVIQNTMIKTTPPGINNSAAYLTILNNSDKDIILTDVASDAAQLVEMHEHIMSNGAMKMQRMEPLKIEANGSVKFQPGGHHIMFIGVTQNIKDGDKIDITLSFDDGTKKIISSIAKNKYEAGENTHKHH